MSNWIKCKGDSINDKMRTVIYDMSEIAKIELSIEKRLKDGKECQTYDIILVPKWYHPGNIRDVIVERYYDQNQTKKRLIELYGLVTGLKPKVCTMPKFIDFVDEMFEEKEYGDLHG